MNRKLENLSHIRHFLIDLDGTTYIGETVLPGVKAFIDHLAKTNRTYQFITNNSSLRSMDYQQKLNRLGIPCSAGQVVTSGDATISYLIENKFKRIFLMGTPELESDFKMAGLILL